MSRHLVALLKAAQKPERLVVGLMSGTSVDAIDVAVCRIGQDGLPVTLVHFGERPYEPALRSTLGNFDILDIRGVAEIHVLIGEAFAAAALAVLKEAGIAPDKVDLIGSHGQTVYHHSNVPGALVPLP